MNEPDNEFESLCKLLSLKRHEVPPPGYFNGFSTEVLARIRSGDTGNSDRLASKLRTDVPWLFQLLNIFQDRPAFAGVFASALCLLLVAGIVYTDNPGSTQDVLMPAQSTDAGSSMASVGAPSAGFLIPSGAGGISVSSTNPVLSLQPTMATFGAENPFFQPAGFSH